MTPEEIYVHAVRIAREYLDDGVEFAYVYEDEDLLEDDPDAENLRAIHDEVQKLLRGVRVA